jgi:predicted N-formylglutamate amidohydrolase
MLAQTDFLTEADGDPVVVDNPQGRGAVLIVCEHASRQLPASVGNMGLSNEALVSHIAWDPGALAVSRLMAERLDAVVISQRFSRLVYDCNRPPESPAAIRDVSEIFRIPANENLSSAEKALRAATVYHPFQNHIAREIEARRQRGQDTVLVTIHSFTPVYFGKPRAVEIGILHDHDRRLADRMLATAEGNARYRVERNEPYGPADGVTHTLELHALPAGLWNVMIEVRNDLLEGEAGQRAAADFLVKLLTEALKA